MCSVVLQLYLAHSGETELYNRNWCHSLKLFWVELLPAQDPMLVMPFDFFQYYKRNSKQKIEHISTKWVMHNVSPWKIAPKLWRCICYMLYLIERKIKAHRNLRYWRRLYHSAEILCRAEQLAWSLGWKKKEQGHFLARLDTVLSVYFICVPCLISFLLIFTPWAQADRCFYAPFKMIGKRRDWAMFLVNGLLTFWWSYF